MRSKAACGEGSRGAPALEAAPPDDVKINEVWWSWRWQTRRVRYELELLPACMHGLMKLQLGKAIGVPRARGPLRGAEPRYNIVCMQ